MLVRGIDLPQLQFRSGDEHRVPRLRVATGKIVSFEVSQDAVELGLFRSGLSFLTLDDCSVWTDGRLTTKRIFPSPCSTEGGIMPRLPSSGSGISGALFSLIPVVAAVLGLLGLAGQAESGPAPAAEKAPTLISGLGNHVHPITTHNPEPQKFCDQGFMLLYRFNPYEALRSFGRAAELDPTAAMPHWGIAMVFRPHINMDFDGDVDMKKSCEALHAAQALVQKASECERAYIDAASARCPEYRPVAYQKAMRGLAQLYPDDLDAATVYAESLMIPTRWKWWTSDGTPAQGKENGL
jgi:hypothetical protein